MIKLKVYAVLVLGVLAAGGVLMLRHDAKVAAKTEQKIVQASEKKGAANAAKAKKAHDDARAPGAVDRLRKDRSTCTDCQ